MSLCEVTLEFGDGEYLFRLPLKMIGELQAKRNAPIGLIYKRVSLYDYYAEDLIETVRYGLMGGGLTGAEARRKIETYCDVWPLETWHTHALAILGACIEGYDDGAAKKKAGESLSSSTSPSPTATEPPSAEPAPAR